MSTALKIVVGVSVFLGILSGIFLLFAKKKTVPVAETQKTIQASAQVKNLNPLPAQQNNAAMPKNNQSAQTDAPQAKTQDRKALIRSQWKQCKEKTITADTNLFWNVQITEGIPTGGTYAKGNLDSDTAFPVRVIIKSDSKIADKIKTMLTPGKTAFLRGICTDVATDGSVVLQAF